MRSRRLSAPGLPPAAASAGPSASSAAAGAAVIATVAGDNTIIVVAREGVTGAGLADHHHGAAVPNAGVAEQTQQALLLHRTAMERRGYLD